MPQISVAVADAAVELLRQVRAPQPQPMLLMQLLMNEVQLGLMQSGNVDAILAKIVAAHR
jgi:hypothetical protein